MLCSTREQTSTFERNCTPSTKVTVADVTTRHEIADTSCSFDASHRDLIHLQTFQHLGRYRYELPFLGRACSGTTNSASCGLSCNAWLRRFHFSVQTFSRHPASMGLLFNPVLFREAHTCRATVVYFHCLDDVSYQHWRAALNPPAP